MASNALMGQQSSRAASVPFASPTGRRALRTSNGRKGGSKACSLQTSPDILGQIPVMRRFARLLLGSVAEGDQLVEEALRRSRATDLRSHDMSLRLTMLGRVIDAHAARPDPATVDYPADTAAPHMSKESLTRAIAGLPAADRIPLLLVCVLSVAAEDAAILLGCTERDVCERVVRARRHILPAEESASDQGVANERAASGH